MEDPPASTAKIRFERIREIFERALNLDEVSQRVSFLQESCGGDNDLRIEVDALLKSHQRSSSLEPPEHGFARQFAESHSAKDIIGSRAGPYSIESLIGSGGMSLVYGGRRTDGRFDLEVAIKVIKRGMDTEELLRRFQLEQQALARLEHPNISRLFDAGTLPDGRPFFVMEKVNGAPITEHCDLHQLTIRQRLSLFRDVCAGTHFAHQQLVVHRDLKPSNILVNENHEPKLLDFGIAKFLSPDAPNSTDPTSLGSTRPMTLAYASPEQLQGKPVTTATDVYALGTLLYELLTGRRPFASLEPTGQKHWNAICSELPQKPSRIVKLPQECYRAHGKATFEITPDQVSAARSSSPGGLAKQLRGDLDNILLTALKPDLSRRYASLDRMSEDVDRFLRGLPVSARPNTLSYRAMKFLRRNRISTALAALFIASLVVTAAIAIVGLHRLKKEQEATKLSNAKRFDSLNFIESMFDSQRYGIPPDQITLKKMLTSSVELLREQDPSKDELTTALIEVTMGKLCALNGLHDEANELFKSSLEIRERITGPESMETAESLINQAIHFRDRGKFDEARRHAELAYSVYKKRKTEDRSLLVLSLSEIGTALCLQGLYTEACPPLEEATQIGLTLEEIDRDIMAATLNSLALAKLGVGDLEAGESLLQKANSIAGNNNPGFSILLNNLAKFHFVRNELDEAESLVSKALSILRESYPHLHRDIGRSLNNLGLIAFGKKDFNTAERRIREGIEAREKALEPSHPTLADSWLNLGRVLQAKGDIDGSRNALKKAIDIYKVTLPADHPRIARIQQTMPPLVAETPRRN